MPVEMFQVQNNWPAPTCLTHHGPFGKEEFLWQGKGDASRMDVQEIPDYVTEGPNFRRIQRRGIVSIVQDRDDDMDAAGDQWRADQEAQRLGSLANIDKDTGRALGMSVPCIGPGPRGENRPCGENVYVPTGTLHAQPPLCADHKRYANHFAFEIDEHSPAGGDIKGKWKLVQLDRGGSS